MKNKIFCVLLLLAVIILFTIPSDEEALINKPVNDAAEIKRMEKIFSEYDKEGAYNYEFKYFSWDLNGDNQSEILRCYNQGSGILYFIIDCYEPVSETFSSLGGNDLRDYTLYLFNNELYVISTENIISSRYDVPHAYKPVLIDDVISYAGLGEKLEEKILKEYEKEHELPLFAQFMQ